MITIGTFMENGPALVMLAPVLYPIAAKFGVDPYHFSMMISMNLVIGLLTPPVALCLSIAALIGKVSMDKVVYESMPFFMAAIASPVAGNVHSADFPADSARAGLNRQHEEERIMHVGVIGVGNMGSGIAMNLIDRGHTVTVRDIRPEAEQRVAAHGAQIAPHPNRPSRKRPTS